MINPLIGIHAALGEVGAIAFIWALVELWNPTEQRIRRASIAAWVGVVAIVLSWISGGYYYVTVYGAVIKPVIKAGPLPWTHGVIMELKEHLFLFLPFVAVLTATSIRKVQTYRPVIILCALIALTVFSIAGMGFLISSGYREALEVIAQ